MTTDPADGFTITNPDGETSFAPTTTANAAALSITAGVAAVAANTGDEVDSVIRPQYNGSTVFTALRSWGSPEEFSWTVDLGKHQTLVSVNSDQAEVVYDSGVVAYLITAEQAHDATGKAVPTLLTVAGTHIALHVQHHSGEFVYPVVAGQAFETGYESATLYIPPPPGGEVSPPGNGETIPKALGETLIRQKTKYTVDVPAPTPCPKQQACASKSRVFEARARSCSDVSCDIFWVQLRHATFLRNDVGVTWCCDQSVICEADVANIWGFNLDLDIEDVGFHEPYIAVRGTGKKLYIYCKTSVEVWPIPEAYILGAQEVLLDRIYPNGYQESIVRDYSWIDEN